MTECDLLLVVGYFRTGMSFLSIVRHLSSELRVAVMPTGASAELRGKTGDAEAHFVDLCRQWGAAIVRGDSPVRTRLMLVQQFDYPEEVAASVRTQVRAERTVGLMALATAGLEKHDAFLEQYGIRKVLAPSRRLIDFLVSRRSPGRYAGIAIEEVGLPFAAHPVFPEFSVDWIIAAPTLFSFRTEEQKQSFLRDVLRLLETLPVGDRVAYKPHNGNALDYFAPRYHYAAASIVRRLPGARRLLELLASHARGGIRVHAQRTLTAVLHQCIFRRVVPLSALTPHADMSLEAFLPGVRKGVIGGLSNTIWGTLYFGLPYYNCVNVEARARSAREVLGHKDPAKFIDLNLEYFGVPYCAGDLAKGSRGETIVTDDDRQGDLIAALRSELRSLTHDRVTAAPSPA